MSENLNWVDQLKNSFRGFEPEVTGDWGRMKQELDAFNAGASDEMQRRMRNAQRIAAAQPRSAWHWMMTPTLLEEGHSGGSGDIAVMDGHGVEAFSNDALVPPRRSSHLQEMKAIFLHLLVPERPIRSSWICPALP